MNLPDPPATDEWMARWIEPPEPADSPAAHRPAYHLAGEVELPDDVTAAVLHVTAHGIYEVFLNGARVGDLEMTPGFTAYRAHLHVQTFDVTRLIQPGANAIGALLSDGWWRGRSTVVRRPDAYGATTALLAELHVTTADGQVHRFGTDDAWRSTPSHVLAADLMAGEVHDLRRRVPGWAEPGTDRTAWSPVRVAEHPTSTLTAPVGPPTRRIEELPARSVTEIAPRRWVVDFGQNSNGWVRLEDLGPAGRELTITYGEWLAPDGDVTQGTLAASGLAPPGDADLPFQVDRVISAGDGSAFEPRHSTKGFQYVRIDGHPGPLVPASICSVVVHTDLRRIGSFRCSDERIDRLHRVAEWTFRANACEVPTDCPTRERAGWVGDWQLYVATAAELYDVTDWSRRWLRDLAADQYPDGSTTSVVPDPSPDDPAWRFCSGSAGWGDAAIHVPWELYRATGRTDVLAAQLDSMRAWMEFVRSAAASGRHPSRVERHPEPRPHDEYLWDTGWHWGEWLEPGVDTTSAFVESLTADHGALATAFFHRSARELADSCALVGRDDLAAEYRELAAKVLAAWRTEFLDEEGAVRPQTQADLVRALAFGLVPEAGRARAASDLVALVRGAGTHLATGFLATPDLLPVLADTGHLDIAYELLFQDTSPSWLAMLDRGATTVWEVWDAVHPDGTVTDSLSHYSKGAVISFLRRYVAGLQILEPGYRRFLVAPRPGGGITSAATHHDGPFGRIEVAWRGDDRSGEVEVVVPEGSEAELRLPSGATDVLGPGRVARGW